MLKRFVRCMVIFMYDGDMGRMVSRVGRFQSGGLGV
jgi:hypothetical protein